MTMNRPEESQVFIDARTQLEDGIRHLVVHHVYSNPTAKTTLATGLRLPEESVDRLLARERWDLPLALSAADHLGVTLHVTGD